MAQSQYLYKDSYLDDVEEWDFQPIHELFPSRISTKSELWTPSNIQGYFGATVGYLPGKSCEIGEIDLEQYKSHLFAKASSNNINIYKALLLFSNARSRLLNRNAYVPTITILNNDITVQVSEREFTLSSELNRIVNEINDAKSLLELEDNWDDEGAIKPSINTFVQAINLLVMYSQWIFKNLDIVIESPVISALPDGSIDLQWKTKKARLLINVKNTEAAEAHYYGDFYNDTDNIKGKLSTNDFQQYFAHWLSNLTA